MRIYYIGQLWEGSTTGERMRILASLGHEIVSFDTTQWISSGNRIFRSLAHRINYGPNVWGLNRSIIKYSKMVGAVDLVWIDKGRWLFPETLHELLENTGGKLLHYTPDSQLLYNKSRMFQASIPYYDWVVTTKPFELDLYKENDAKNIIFILQGYDSRFIEYKPILQDTDKWSSDVCFIGHCESHYAARLKSVSEVHSKISIWGPGWEQLARRNNWIQPFVSGSGLWGNDYLHALTHTKIAIGLLSKRFPETTTTRSFEIPAIGTFMLAERTDEHLELFEEGVEAEYFSDDEELKDKIRFYLVNDKARKKIAIAGRERCVKSGYSSVNQLNKILSYISSSD